MRLVAAVRQSRANDGSLSPEVQEQRIREWAASQGHELVDVIVELDVSGGTPLAKRKMKRAIEAVERGAADGLVSAYFDRLFRDLGVQAEVITRVEAKEGKIFALDSGEVSHGTAASWQMATSQGMVAEFHRRITSEKVRAAQAALVAKGIPPRGLPLGLTLEGEGDARHVTTTEEIELVREVFRMRDERKSLGAIRAFLRSAGFPMVDATIDRLLTNRLYVGEIHWGDLRNLTAFPPVVDRALFERVQTRRAPRGPIGKSDRLLARQDILHCGSCGSAMSVGSASQNEKRVVMYACRNYDYCSRAVSINADAADAFVWEKTLEVLGDVRGVASVHARLAELEAEAQAAERERDEAVEELGHLKIAALRSKLEALDAKAVAKRAAADEARARIPADEVVDVHALEGATLDQRRKAVRIAIDRVDVLPGVRGRKGVDLGRLVVRTFSEQAAA